MVGNALRALWAEPRPAHPPVRVWRDWALVAVVVSWSIVETMLREDLAWRPVVLTVSVVIALTLLWRRTRPLGAVAVAFGTLIAFDVARILAVDTTGLLSIAAALLLPYSLFRWGAGREAAIGLGVVLAWLAVTHVADPTGAAEVVAGYGFFLFSAALGASIRYHAGARIRDIEQAKLRERNQLARELHDTVGHHVSAIAIQAQAGRALAASHPDRALATLETIEEAASRTLEEMRAMVGVLRDGAELDLAPQPGVADVERLARSVGGWPRVDVRLSGDVDDLSPSVGAALYRIAQEAVTNAVRHARHATRVVVHVAGEGEQVRLTVSDDGDASATGPTPPGYGLVGMAERASLLGGTLRAGPAPGGGWTVDAVLPKAGASA
jgi:signal transduction histidine kinase